MRTLVGGESVVASGAIGHVKPLMPARTVGVQLAGGLGRTDELLWYTWKLSAALPYP
jgi:hypothetical protein